jgi:hypothetical protein
MRAHVNAVRSVSADYVRSLAPTEGAYPDQQRASV